MRILVSGPVHKDGFATNIASAIRQMGHEVLSFHPLPSHRIHSLYWSRFWTYVPRIFPQIEQRRHDALVRVADDFQPDLLLLTHSTTPPEVVRRVRRSCRAKIALWFPDHLANLGRQYMLASDLDAWFFKDPYMVRVFRDKLGINAHYLPEACNPVWHRRVELTDAERRKYGCDLATASAMYYYRAKMLEIFKDYDLKIWGTSYPRWLQSPLRPKYPGIYVAELEKSKAFNAAKIVLNTMIYAEIEGVNCRLFEAAGCGAFQIADWKPALDSLFKPEREVVTFETRDELKEKVDYYLSRPEERQQIADRAYARAHREHTYEMRLREMFRVMGLGGTLSDNQLSHNLPAQQPRHKARAAGILLRQTTETPKTNQGAGTCASS